MRLSGLLIRGQIEDIHRNSLRVLEDVGVKVEHDELRLRLTSVGGRIDGECVRFDPKVVERLIRDAPKDSSRPEPPIVTWGVSVYQCQYLDPRTNELVPFDEALLARYLGLAEHLGIPYGMLGAPFVPDDIPAQHLSLAEKLFSWKYGGSPGGMVYSTDLCEPLLEMFRIHADATGKRLDEVFCAGGWMISPLKLGRPECEQLLFFAGRGLRMFIGHQPSQGGTAPVTLAGTLTLALAEQMFIFLLNKALWGDGPFGLGAEVSPIDLRTGVMVYGRPEQQRTNLAFSDIAEFYGCSCGGHTGCTDAHVPSNESGAQKAVGVVMTALATGHAYMEAGLLGVDEICSPVQMVLDDDLGHSLRALLAGASLDDVETAFDEIAASGIGGNHLGTDYTAERFRSEMFMPSTWSNQLISAWQASGSKNDVDKARGIVWEFDHGFAPTSRISEDEELALRAVIRHASHA